MQIFARVGKNTYKRCCLRSHIRRPSRASRKMRVRRREAVRAGAEGLVEIDRGLFCRSTVDSFVDQSSETNTDDEPWNGEKEMMLLCRVKQCDVFSFSLRNIWTS
jgi:hypothetical protein